MELWLFIGAPAAIYLLPGPDMILVLQTCSQQGHARALATAAGLAVARGLHVALAALGLATLFATAPWTFDAVRYAGGAYLAWIGLQLFRSPGATTNIDAGGVGMLDDGHRRAWPPAPQAALSCVKTPPLRPRGPSPPCAIVDERPQTRGEPDAGT